jgi:PAS domain S-box-containing protein
MDHAFSARKLAAELREAELTIAALRAQLDLSAVSRLTDSLLDGFALFDPAAVVLDVNPALCAMTGFAADELIGTAPPHPCWPPEELDQYLKALAEVVSGRARPVELHLRRKDDTRLPALITPSVLRGDDGEIVSVTLLFKDLTERRRFEAALAESEELFRLTFDQAPVGAVLTDHEFRFTQVNDTFCAMLGYTRRELLALSFPEVTHPDDAAVDVHEVDRLSRGEIDRHVREKRYVRKDGAVVWGRVVVRPVVNARGDRIAQLAMIDDITQGRHALDDLRASEQRLRSILDAAHEGIILQARDGTILTFNRAAGEVFGVEESEVVGESALGRDWQTVREDGTPWSPDEHPTMTAMTSGRPARDVVLGVVRGEETRWLNVNAYPVIPEGETEPVAAVVSFADQTERLQAERALTESEERNRLLLQNANDAVIVHQHSGDPSDRLLEVNDRAAELSGYTREELLSLTIGDLVPPADLAGVPGIVENLGTTSHSVYDARLVDRGGHLIPVEVSTRAFEMRGEPLVLSTIRDISERVAAEAEMRALVATRDVAEQVAGVGSWRIDLATGQSVWSPQMFRLFDLEPEGFDGNLEPIAARLHDDDRHIFLETFESAASADETNEVDLRVVRRDGEVCTVHVASTLERDDAGRATAMVGYCQDVTRQRADERALRDAEERFRDLFEQSPVPIWEEDFSGLRAWWDARQDVQDWPQHLADHPDEARTCAGLVRIVSSNRAGLEFFGATSVDELAANLATYLSAGSNSAFCEAIAMLAAGGTRFSSELPLFDPRSGKTLTVSLNLTVVRGHEKALDQVLVSFFDVTERQRAEAEIRRLNQELQRRIVSRTEQLDAVSRELEALAYSIAHDVRAPLRTIDGFSAAVLEDESDALSEDAVASLQRVRAAAQTLARLLDDLTGLSRVSRRELVRRTVDLTALAEEVALEIALENRPRSVEFVVAPDLSAEVDPMLARIVLRELLGNAWKFTAAMDVAHVEFGALETDDGRTFFVRDDGAGFDMRYAEHLFGVFQRMHPPGEFAGDGVGLTMVQRLVRRHGGRCWAEAEPGAGATFFFTLPGRGAED